MDQSSESPSATVDDRLHFESFVADVSARFVNLPADQVDAEIEAAQRQIVEALGLDRSTLFELLTDGTTLVFTHFWARPGFPDPPKRLDTRQHFPWISARLLRGEIVSYSSLAELPPHCRDLVVLRSAGSTSLVSVPLQVGGQVVGILNFGTLGRERHWHARGREPIPIDRAGLRRRLGTQAGRSRLARGADRNRTVT